MENFGQRLRNLRGERPQKEVANELGMPATTLSTLETQESVPRGEVLQKLAEYFKVPVTYFYRTQSVQLQSSEAAKQWLQHIRTSSFNAKPTIATNATDEVDPDTKKRIAQALAQMKQNGEISDDE